MRIGRWSELSVDSVCQEHEVMRDVDANETSGGSKRHSLQAVELSQRTQAAVQIVSNLPAPSNGGPIYRFLNKKVWICDICHKQIHVRKQISIRCNRIEHWVHLRCAGIRQAQYTDTWTCHLHRESRLTPHTDITPPHRTRPLPIITTINIRHDYRLQQNRRTFTNYKKADWTQFTEDTESAFAQTTIPTNIHTANRIFTNIILMADKQNIPNGKMHSNCRLLPEDIVCKITQRNNIRRENTCDPALKLLNEEITSDIQKHKQNIWKEHLDAHWDHRHNTHTLWKTIHGLSNRAPPHTLNTSITFNNKIATTPTHIANCFTKQFTNTVKTNRHINRATHNIQGYNITLTTSQVQEAIKQSKNNNSQGPDKLDIRHLKHIGPLGLAFLTSMFKLLLTKT